MARVIHQELKRDRPEDGGRHEQSAMVRHRVVTLAVALTVVAGIASTWMVLAMDPESSLPALQGGLPAPRLSSTVAGEHAAEQSDETAQRMSAEFTHGGRFVPETAPYDSTASDDVSVPPQPGAALQRLADGTRVWVVRHASGSGDVSVLAADVARVAPSAPIGLREQVLWVPWENVFLPANPARAAGRYDAYGRAQGGLTRPDMDTYAIEVIDDATVRVLERHAGQQRVLATLEELGIDPWMPVHMDGAVSPDPVFGPALSIADAMAQPVGSIVLIDAALIIPHGGSARVCERRIVTPVNLEVCAADDPAAFGVAASDVAPGATWYVAGPLVARVQPGGFDRLISVWLAGAGTL